MDFWEVINRSETGSMIEQNEFDLNMVSKKCTELVSKYAIKHNPDEIIPSDFDLADKYGMQALNSIHTDVLNLVNSRLVKFTEQVVKNELKNVQD
jgi:uncharacterized protein YaaR (DUF327 family)